MAFAATSVARGVLQPPYIVNRNLPIARSLIGCWMPQGGYYPGLTGNIKHGVVDTGSPSFESSELGVPCFEYNNNSCHLLNLNRASNSFETLSISCWIYKTSSTGNDDIVGTNSIALRDDDSVIKFLLRDAAWRTANGRFTISTGRWYHICAVWASSNIQKVYINGIPGGNASTIASAPLSSSLNADLYTAGNGGSANFIDGRTTFYAVWERVLGPEEIRWLYAPSTRWELIQPARTTVFFDPHDSQPGPSPNAAAGKFLGAV